MPTTLQPPHTSTGRDLLAEFFRCPAGLSDFVVSKDATSAPGFFRFGPGAIGFGSTTTPCPAKADGALPDLLSAVRPDAPLPFDPAMVIDNLRLERYCAEAQAIQPAGLVRKIYYLFRPLLGTKVRNILQRRYFKGWKDIPFPKWPVDTSVENIHRELLSLGMKRQGLNRVPFIWFWPDGASAAAVMTHDVEEAEGRDFIPRLMEIDAECGIYGSYQLVPEVRYENPRALLEQIRSAGCEVNVHDLKHDGHLFQERESFRAQASLINTYLAEFQAEGFRAACMYHNQSWFGDLQAAYDMSVPNVAHLEPQRGGCCTVFPYFVGDVVELPLTMTQDFSLFNMLQSYSMDLWEQQFALIRAQHGLMSFIVHPDYILEDRPQAAYKTLLRRLAVLRDQEGVWLPLPREVARWWRDRAAMTLVADGDSYRIEGPGSTRARLAWAVREGENVRYELA